MYTCVYLYFLIQAHLQPDKLSTDNRQTQLKEASSLNHSNTTRLVLFLIVNTFSPKQDAGGVNDHLLTKEMQSVMSNGQKPPVTQQYFFSFCSSLFTDCLGRPSFSSSSSSYFTSPSTTYISSTSSKSFLFTVKHTESLLGCRNISHVQL